MTTREMANHSKHWKEASITLLIKSWCRPDQNLISKPGVVLIPGFLVLRSCCPEGFHPFLGMESLWTNPDYKNVFRNRKNPSIKNTKPITPIPRLRYHTGFFFRSPAMDDKRMVT